jgi:hypothetical protein
MATFDPLSLTNNTIAQLHKSRYAIVDNFLTEDFASQLLRDAEKLFAKNLLKEHYFQFGGSLLKKPNVYELDLSGGDVLNEEVGCWADILRDGPLFVSKMDELDRRAAADLAAAPQPRLLSLDTNSAPAIKLQINIGGGSFPWHYDNVSIQFGIVLYYTFANWLKYFRDGSKTGAKLFVFPIMILLLLCLQI